VAGITITVSGIVAALGAHAELLEGSSNARAERLNQVLLVLTITLVTLAAVNAIFITWATALDARRSSALARALGAAPDQVSAGLSAAQVLSAIVGAIIGIPAGLALLAAVDPDSTTTPPIWQLIAVVPGTALVAICLTAVPPASAHAGPWPTSFGPSAPDPGPRPGPGALVLRSPGPASAPRR